MRRLNPVFFLFLAGCVFLLASCENSGGYSSKRMTRYSQTGQIVPDVPGAPGQETATAPQQQVTMPAPAARDAGLPPVKVAILLPLSGQHAELGQSMLNAAQLALFNVAYSNFELVPYDTKGVAQDARMAAQQALKENAQLLLGPVFADEVRAVKPLATSAKINLIAFSTDWTLAGGNTYTMGFLPFDQVDRIIDYAARQNMKRIALATPDSEYGRMVSSTFDKAASRNQVAMPARVSFSARGANLAGDIQALTRNQFDAVLMPVGGEQAVEVSNLLTQNGATAQLVKRLGTGLLDDARLFKDPNLNGALFAAPSPQLRAEFEREFKDTYGYTAPRLATLAYDATALAAVLAQKGLQTHGQPEFGRAAIINPSGFNGIDGIFRFRENGMAERGLAVLEISGGSVRVVDEAPTTFRK